MTFWIVRRGRRDKEEGAISDWAPPDKGFPRLVAEWWVDVPDLFPPQGEIWSEWAFGTDLKKKKEIPVCPGEGVNV